MNEFPRFQVRTTGLPGCLFLIFLISVGLFLLTVWAAGIIAVSILRIFMPGLARPGRPEFFTNTRQRYQRFSGKSGQEDEYERVHNQDDDDVIECEVIHTGPEDAEKDPEGRKMLE